MTPDERIAICDEFEDAAAEFKETALELIQMVEEWKSAETCPPKREVKIA